MKNSVIVLLVCLCSFKSFAQNGILTGSIHAAENNTPISNATVRLLASNDSLLQVKLTGKDGQFSFQKLAVQTYKLKITHVMYDSFATVFLFQGDTMTLNSIRLTVGAKQLQTIFISPRIPPVRQKGDTLEYNANQFKVNPDATAEDLIQKMPGITVENGKVVAQGEDVKKVLIDGQEFFGDDATLAIRNLPAEIIEKVQVFDRLSEQAQLTGFDDGNTSKTINIVTKNGITNSRFGKIFGGYGTDQRYKMGGNINIFNGDSRISLIGLTNNINEQNFSSQDILGLQTVSAGGRRGGGRSGGGRTGGAAAGGRGGRGGSPTTGGGSTDNFLIGQQPGINTTNSVGINYSDKWGTKLQATGSYFFNNSKTLADQLSSTEYFISADSSQIFKETSASEINNFNHRINLRVEYRLDSANIFIISPSLSFQNNKNNSFLSGNTASNTGQLINAINNTGLSKTDGYNLRNSLIYRHSFEKRGRSITVGVNTGVNNKFQDKYSNAFSTYFDFVTVFDTLRQFSDYQTAGKTIGGSLRFTEPIGKGLLQINYNPSYTKTEAVQNVYHYNSIVEKYELLDSNLSNIFDNSVTVQNAGIAYSIGSKGKQLTMGANYQNTMLRSHQSFPALIENSKVFSNILPSVTARLKISSGSSFQIQYRANVSPPSISQLQNLIDISDPLFVSTGNPDLSQQFSHNLNSRYTYTNITKGLTFIGNLFFQTTSNYIGNASFVAASDSVLAPGIILFKGSQLAKPVNLSGFWSVRSLVTMGIPVSMIKSNLNLNAGVSYNRLPGFVNNVNSTTQNYFYNLGFVLSSNISEQVDFTASFTAGYNQAINSLQPELENNYYTHSARVRLNLLSKNGWKFDTDLTNQLYKGLTAEFNQNFWLWNVGVAKKLLKDNRGELKFSVFDLLNQNQSVNRTVTENYIQDEKIDVLRQYFMLTFTYTLRNFNVGK